MTFSTYDPRNIIRTILHKYGIPQFAFYSLQTESRVSQWKIQRAMRGECAFDKTEGEHLVRLARECEALVNSFPLEDGEPCQLEWRDTRLISGLLKRRKEQLGKQKEEEKERRSPDWLAARLEEA